MSLVPSNLQEIKLSHKELNNLLTEVLTTSQVRSRICASSTLCTESQVLLLQAAS